MTGSATKQSSFLVAAKLDCFASLAMTNGDIDPTSLHHALGNEKTRPLPAGF
jgi:hypothetical protein